MRPDQTAPLTDEGLFFLSISALARLYAARVISPVEALKAILDRIDRLNPHVNAWIEIGRDDAMESAQASEAAFMKARPRGLLEGVPIGVKDCIEVRGMHTTFGSRVRVHGVAPDDCTAVARLRAAGALVIGKTNLMEFCMGDDLESPFGRCSNPWDFARITRGSSSGSAVAVASGFVFGALGSDTGGSIRAPSSLCGVVGMKPSYGRISRHGTGDVAWTLDHAGPIGRTVEDVAILLEAMGGFDPSDPTTEIAPLAPSASQLDERSLAGLRIGIVRDYPVTPVTPVVGAAFEASLQLLQRAGAELVELTIPSLPYANDAAWLILSAEAASIHEEMLRTQRSLYTASTLRRLGVGESCLAGDYLFALRYRARLIDEFAEAFKSVEVIFWPTMVSTAGFPRPEGQPGDLALNLELRAPYNLTGLPALTMPVGLDPDGMPIGMQFAGPLYSDGRVLQVARSFEAIAGWQVRTPAALANVSSEPLRR